MFSAYWLGQSPGLPESSQIDGLFWGVFCVLVGPVNEPARIKPLLMLFWGVFCVLVGPVNGPARMKPNRRAFFGVFSVYRLGQSTGLPELSPIDGLFLGCFLCIGVFSVYCLKLVVCYHPTPPIFRDPAKIPRKILCESRMNPEEDPEEDTASALQAPFGHPAKIPPGPRARSDANPAETPG